MAYAKPKTPFEQELATQLLATKEILASSPGKVYIYAVGMEGTAVGLECFSVVQSTHGKVGGRELEAIIIGLEKELARLKSRAGV